MKTPRVSFVGDDLSVNHTTFKAFAQKEPNSVSYRMKNPADLQRCPFVENLLSIVNSIILV